MGRTECERGQVMKCTTKAGNVLKKPQIYFYILHDRVINRILNVQQMSVQEELYAGLNHPVKRFLRFK